MKPKVLWLRIKEQMELIRLKKLIDDGLDEINLSYDKKPSLPLLTIGRAKTPLKTKPLIEKKILDFKLSFSVTVL